MSSEQPRNALVAGGGGALGRALVAEQLAAGFRVCVPWVVEEEATALATAHADARDAGRLRLARCDVTDRDALAALLDVLVEDWGPLWLAASLVGGWAGGMALADLDDLALFDRMATLNLRSAAAVAAEGLRHMGPAGGRVVLVGSATVLGPAGGQAAYSAAKAGVHALVQTLAVELRGSGRTANAVVPKVIDTPANRRAMPDADHARWVPPQAIAKVIAWLAGDDSWPVSGALIPVFGDA